MIFPQPELNGRPWDIPNQQSNYITSSSWNCLKFSSLLWWLEQTKTPNDRFRGEKIISWYTNSTLKNIGVFLTLPKNLPNWQREHKIRGHLYYQPKQGKFLKSTIHWHQVWSPSKPGSFSWFPYKNLVLKKHTHRVILERFINSFNKTFNKFGWWLQPIRNILVKLDHFPRDTGENEKYLSCHQPEFHPTKLLGNFRKDPIPIFPLIFGPHGPFSLLRSQVSLAWVPAALRVAVGEHDMKM